MNWKIIARHRDWIKDTTITESYCIQNDNIRRFTTTICNWNNWRIYEGKINDEILQKIIEKVKEIKRKIENGSDDSIWLHYDTIPALRLYDYNKEEEL